MLDTSAYSHLRAGHGEVLARLSAAKEVVLTATVLGELQAAFRLGRRARENQAALERFLGEAFVREAPVTAETARRYGQVFAALRRAGTPIPVNDVWIAASTLELGGHLLTFDTDFERVPGLSCDVLTP